MDSLSAIKIKHDWCIQLLDGTFSFLFLELLFCLFQVSCKLRLGHEVREVPFEASDFSVINNSSLTEISKTDIKLLPMLPDRHFLKALATLLRPLDLKSKPPPELAPLRLIISC